MACRAGGMLQCRMAIHPGIEQADTRLEIVESVRPRLSRPERRRRRPADRGSSRRADPRQRADLPADPGRAPGPRPRAAPGSAARVRLRSDPGRERPGHRACAGTCRRRPPRSTRPGSRPALPVTRARPTVTDRDTDVPPTSIGAATAVRSRSTRSSISSSLRSSVTMTNSSPPKRAVVSPARTCDSSRLAMIASTWSPNACPSVSLTGLKSSRSQNSTAPARWLRRAAVTASCTRSARALRLSRPVSGSIRARRVSSWCSARRSLMSSNWLMP